ncbi:hypothetical protein [Clostridium sp. 1001275B_160808_H3]|uniref:hyaluronate lyase N-terminal domain-containing protein n=1 Tax=Clostridium sp. 1001275B_160808_H3 TaxID=2787110 RepID=UPI00189703A4|nr:hypothetical protein [Clostridium sp. 1001275B_160808_H3]
MANKIQIKRGLKAKLPVLDIGEPALCTDSEEVFIGGNGGNIKLVDSKKIVDNLTAGGADKVLSAEQGKVIKSELNTKSNLNNKRVDLINTTMDTEGTLNVANFSGQNKGSLAPIGNVIHNYTDGIALQIDEVGEGNTILVLKNANNPSRRPDKPSNYVGNAHFLDCLKHVDGGEISLRLFRVGNNGNLYWFDKSDTVLLYSNKQEDGTPAFQIQTSTKHNQLLKIMNETLTELIIQHNMTNNYTELLVGNSGAGLNIQTAVGDIVLKPATNKVYANGVLYMLENGNYGRAVMASSGSSALRPTPTYIGQPYFDTQLGKPIWCKQFSPSVIWVDANGSVV